MYDMVLIVFFPILIGLVFAYWAGVNGAGGRTKELCRYGAMMMSVFASMFLAYNVTQYQVENKERDDLIQMIKASAASLDIVYKTLITVEMNIDKFHSDDHSYSAVLPFTQIPATYAMLLESDRFVKHSSVGCLQYTMISKPLFEFSLKTFSSKGSLKKFKRNLQNAKTMIALHLEYMKIELDLLNEDISTEEAGHLYLDVFTQYMSEFDTHFSIETTKLEQ